MSSSRWPPKSETEVVPGITVTTPTPEGQRLWDADVAAFLASKHSEPRVGGESVVGTPGWAYPLPGPGERLVLSYGSHWLFEVPDYGFRVVNLVVDGMALIWELPGYNRSDAKRMAHNLADGYL
jgi:hypothetical protein